MDRIQHRGDTAIPQHGNNPFNISFRVLIFCFLIQLTLIVVGGLLFEGSAISSSWEDDSPKSFHYMGVVLVAGGGLLWIIHACAIKKRWEIQTPASVHSGLDMIYCNLFLLFVVTLVVVGFLVEGSSVCRSQLDACEVSDSCIVATADEASSDLPTGIECCHQADPGNGICDKNCNHTRFGFDGGDCISCADGCIVSNLGNGICEQSCNNTACNYDSGDCGVFLDLTFAPTLDNGLEKVYCEDLLWTEIDHGGGTAAKKDCCVSGSYESMCRALAGLGAAGACLAAALLLANLLPLARYCCRENLGLGDPPDERAFRFRRTSPTEAGTPTTPAPPAAAAAAAEEEGEGGGGGGGRGGPLAAVRKMGRRRRQRPQRSASGSHLALARDPSWEEQHHFNVQLGEFVARSTSDDEGIAMTDIITNDRIKVVSGGGHMQQTCNDSSFSSFVSSGDESIGHENNMNKRPVEVVV